MNKKVVFSLVLLISILLIPLTGMQAVEEYRIKPARIMLQSPSPDIRPVRREKAIEWDEKRTERSKTFIMPDQSINQELLFLMTHHLKIRKMVS
ncbi:MAG: hypothetical protein PHD83_02225 [Caldisericia bacterium]|nr:hypothetical protein [Caldisericia bacterium]